MGAPFLQLENITKSFYGVNALQDVNFSINSGETCCLLGENGSGKSTLIKIISGVYAPDAGEIILDGVRRERLTPIQSIKAGVQIIYQDFSVFPNLSVAENVALSSLVSEKRVLMNRREMRNIAGRALAQIGVDLPLGKLVAELPVAGKQLVAIARGIAQDARLIVMDEPTTALTHREILALYGIIDTLKARGISIIFVSHKLEEVFNISEKIVILRNGKKVLDDFTESFDRDSLTYHMTGKEIPSTPYHFHPAASGAVPILEVAAFSRKGGFEDVNFALYPEEILGITGQLGSGRTELAKALFGIGQTTGSVRLLGQDVKISSVMQAHRLGVGYLPEDRLAEGLFLERSLQDNIVAASVDELADGLRVRQKKFRRAAEGWLTELEVASPGAETPVQLLSGGNQQRVVLAKWLATHPKLLVLNCPTVGVDVGSKSQIHNIIKKLAQEGMGIIVISDDIGEIMTLCSRVLLMRGGRVVHDFYSDETSAESLEQELTRAG